MTDELPRGWAWANIADVTEKVPNTRLESSPDKEFGYIDISAIDNSCFAVKEIKHFKGKNAPSRARRPIGPNDVLFSNVRTYLRNIALIEPGCPAEVCSTGFTVLRPNSAVEPHFLFRYVLTDAFIDKVTPQQTGTHYPATSDRVVMSHKIPLAPKAEQQRIVERLEKLLADVEQCKERMVKIPELLKRFRQSVLAAACSGRLTADWREQRDVHNEKAPTENEEYSFPIPNSWEWCNFNHVAKEITVGYVGPMAKEYVSSGIPFLRSLNVRPFRFDPSDLKYISRDFHERIKKSRLAPGDVAIVRSGNSGIACVIPEALAEANCSDLVILRPAPELIAQYACIFLNSNVGRAHVNAMKVGIAQGHFNVGSMKTTLLPLPTTSEQEEIVNRVQKLFALADFIEERFLGAKKQVDGLTQAILAKAFRGELVPTEAELAARDGRDYESSAKLLERIRSATVAAKIVAENTHKQQRRVPVLRKQ